MFIVVRQNTNGDKIIFENFDFDSCVQHRQKKMKGSDDMTTYTIYRKDEYLSILAERQLKLDRHNHWNKQRKYYGQSRKNSAKRTQ